VNFTQLTACVVASVAIRVHRWFSAKPLLAFVRKQHNIEVMATSWVRQLFKRPPRAGLESTQSKADHGDAEAQFSLGLKFASGGPAWLDYSKAAHWYLMAANQNHALAQFNLGLMFAGGQGVAKDPDQALMWILKAAQQGDAGAQFHLGMKHRRASFDGPPKDKLESNLEAYKWFRLAAAQGYRASAAAREDIAIGFTRAQVDEGNDRAEACLPARQPPLSA
jgi:TPR repeat protein